MTRVCIVGDEDVNLRYELLSRETSRGALATYTLDEPFENSVAVETVSLGAAVSLLNDLNWYLVRFADVSLVLEPSVSPDEWLSRELATAVRDGDVSPAESGTLLKVHDVVDGRLTDPEYVRREGVEALPDADDESETVVVRVTEGEFDG